MSTFVDCPSCGRQLRVTEDLEGGRLRCPACDSAFVAPAATPGVNGDGPAGEDSAKPKAGTPWSVTPNAPPAPPPPPLPEPSASDVPEEAEDDEDERPWEQPYREAEVRRDCEPHRGTLILSLGIVSLVLPVPVVGLIIGIVVILMGRTDLRKMESGAMDPEGKGTTLAGWICGIIGTIFQGLYTIFVILYIVLIVFVFVAISRSVPVPPPPPPRPAPVMPPPKMGRLDVPGGAPLALRDYLPNACATVFG